MREILSDLLSTMYKLFGSSITGVIWWVLIAGCLGWFFIHGRVAAPRYHIFVNWFKSLGRIGKSAVVLLFCVLGLTTFYENMPYVQARIVGKNAYLLCNTTKSNRGGVVMSRGIEVFYLPNKEQNGEKLGITDEKSGNTLDKIWLSSIKPKTIESNQNTKFNCEDISSVNPRNSGKLYITQGVFVGQNTPLVEYKATEDAVSEVYYVAVSEWNKKNADEGKRDNNSNAVLGTPPNGQINFGKYTDIGRDRENINKLFLETIEKDILNSSKNSDEYFGTFERKSLKDGMRFYIWVNEKHEVGCSSVNDTINRSDVVIKTCRIIFKSTNLFSRLLNKFNHNAVNKLEVVTSGIGI